MMQFPVFIANKFKGIIKVYVDPDNYSMCRALGDIGAWRIKSIKTENIITEDKLFETPFG